MKNHRCMAALLGLVIAAGTGQAKAGSLRDDCPGVWVAFQMMPEAPGDVGVPLPDGAAFFGGNPGGKVRVNQDSYTQLPMARFLVRLSVEEATAFYRKRLGSEWQQGDLFGIPVFLRRADIPKDGNLRNVLLSKPGARPSVMLSEAEGDDCPQQVLKGARTMIEIVFER